MSVAFDSKDSSWGEDLVATVSGSDPDGDWIGYQYRLDETDDWHVDWKGEFHFPSEWQKPKSFQARVVDEQGAVSKIITFDLPPDLSPRKATFGRPIESK